jgi:hypothetical protein
MSSPNTPPETHAKPPSPESDEALVARTRNKDFAAFEELLSRYEDKVFGWPSAS